MLIGDNRQGQLGLSCCEIIGGFHSTSRFPDFRKISFGYRHTAIVDHHNKLYMFGSNDCGQLGRKGSEESASGSILSPRKDEITRDGIENNPHKPVLALMIVARQNVIKVSCGKDFTLILDSSRKVWASGCNSFGQLGTGDQNNRQSFTQVMFPGDNQSTSVTNHISCGEGHSMIVDSEGAVWSFGNNCYFQLGRITRGDISKTPKKLSQLPITISKTSSGHFHSVLLSRCGTELLLCGTFKPSHNNRIFFSFFFSSFT